MGDAACEVIMTPRSHTAQDATTRFLLRTLLELLLGGAHQLVDVRETRPELGISVAAANVKVHRARLRLAEARHSEPAIASGKE
jgi:hypothetical protein